MGVPKRKTSQARRDKRRAHKKLTAVTLSNCPQCTELRMPHRVCPACGYYHGREVIEAEES
jgi:large subunit ribosomal protein L32